MQGIDNLKQTSAKRPLHKNEDSLATELRVGCVWQPDNPDFHNQTIKVRGWKLHLINADQFHSGNVIVLKRKGLSLVIDSGCDISSNLQKLINTADATSSERTFLVNTHGHPDHTGGNTILATDGAIVVSHEHAKESMIDYGLVDKKGLPSITFKKRMNISLGSQVIKLIHLPSGHTDGDIAIWIPKLNILHTGDTFMSHDYPLIDQRNHGAL